MKKQAQRRIPHALEGCVTKNLAKSMHAYLWAHRSAFRSFTHFLRAAVGCSVETRLDRFAPVRSVSGYCIGEVEGVTYDWIVAH